MINNNCNRNKCSLPSSINAKMSEVLLITNDDGYTEVYNV